MDPAVTGEPGQAPPLARHIGDFLTDLANAGAAGHTLRAYRGDLAQFAAHHDAEIGDLDAATIRAYLAGLAALAPSTRKRKRRRWPRSAAGRSATTCWARTRSTRSTPSRCPGACPGRRGRRRRRGAGGDLQPPAPQGPAAGPAAGPGAVRDRARLRCPGRRGLWPARGGPGPASRPGPWARRWKPPAASWKRPAGWPRSAGSTTPRHYWTARPARSWRPQITGSRERQR